MNYTIGVSVGNLSDRSAASVVRRLPQKPLRWIDGQCEPRPASGVECVHLQVWQPGTPHTQVLTDIIGIVNHIQGKPAFRDSTRDAVTVVIDVTVAGAAVSAMFEKALGEVGVQVLPFVITAGTQAGRERVPKRDLASVVRVLLEERRFTYATQLEHAATLQVELQHFKMEKTSGNDNEIDWRTRPHDDLVLATALACWHTQNVGEVFIMPGIWG